jgi:hypothetical protein
MDILFGYRLSGFIAHVARIRGIDAAIPSLPQRQPLTILRALPHSRTPDSGPPRLSRPPGQTLRPADRRIACVNECSFADGVQLLPRTCSIAFVGTAPDGRRLPEYVFHMAYPPSMVGAAWGGGGGNAMATLFTVARYLYMTETNSLALH